MNRVEVFVEPHCPSCLTVLRMLTSLAPEVNCNLRIVHRTTSPLEFICRGVVITPATFLNGRLVFYGEFSEEALARHLHHSSNNHLQKE